MTLTTVCIIWIALSLTVAASFWFSLLEPFWFINSGRKTSLGVYSYCVTGDVITESSSSSAIATSLASLFFSSSETSKVACHVYGGRFQLTYMPSGPWQAACVLFGAGAILMSFAAALAVGTVCLSTKHDSMLATVTGYIQIVAVAMFTGGLVVFPAGFDSQFARQTCSGAMSYWPGECIVGWTAVLAVVSDSLAVFCPFLSHHIHTPFRTAQRSNSQHDV